MKKEYLYAVEIQVKVTREEVKPKTIIGRKYYPVDNSYLKHISGEILEPYKNDRLAGCWNENQKETIVVSEPYEDKCEDNFGDHYNDIHTFINVLYNNSIYRVLYYEHAFEPKENLDWNW